MPEWGLGFASAHPDYWEQMRKDLADVPSTVWACLDELRARIEVLEAAAPRYLSASDLDAINCSLENPEVCEACT